MYVSFSSYLQNIITYFSEKDTFIFKNIYEYIESFSHYGSIIIIDKRNSNRNY